MASSTLSTYNSSIATDPLRAFRFNASFTITTGTNIPKVFDARIGDAKTATAPVTGVSSGWVGGFTNVSGLRIDTQAIQYREGGYNTTVHQMPGMTTFSPITFTRGVLFGNDQAIAWMRGLFSAAAGEGLNNSAGNFRVDIVITVNDHPNTNVQAEHPKMQFKIHNAWITSLSYTDLDATNGAILFETMQLVHEGISVSYVTTNSATKLTTPVAPATGGGSGGRGATAQ
jgi:phage tail-like protein